MVNSLQQMAQRRDAWLNEKPQWDGGNELRLSNGDIVWLQFVANGDETPVDKYIKVYRAHAFDVLTNGGKRNQIFRYCPVASGEGNECAYCAQGHNTIKERMSMWFWVPAIYRAGIRQNTPPDKIPPLILHEGRQMYNETVQAFKIWHTSAWRESPWMDIVKLNEMYKGLHGFAAQLTSSGEGMQKRYKLYPIPNTPSLSAEIYQRAQTECQPIPDILRDQLASPVAINPAMQQQPQQQQQTQVPNVITPSQAPFSTGATSSPPPGGGFNPFANAAPVAAPASEVASPPWESSPEPQNGPAAPESTPEPQQNLPLQSMF